MPTPDEVRTELIRSRGFIRGAETQLTKAIAAHDALYAAPTEPSEPTPDPEPDSEPDPLPPSDPVTGEILHIDWSTALGNSVEAVGDGGKGIMRWCDWPQCLGVVDVDGVRALGIRSIGGCGHVEFPDLYPLPAAGQVWGMSYLAMQEAGQTDTKMHPHCFWPVGQIGAVHLSISARGGGAWTPHPRFGWGDTFPFGVLAYRDGEVMVVQPGEWIRYWFELHWQSSTEYVTRMRIESPEGVTITDDFRGTDWPQARVVDQVASCPNSENMRTPSFGMGQAGSSGQRYFVADARFWVR